MSNYVSQPNIWKCDIEAMNSLKNILGSILPPDLVPKRFRKSRSQHTKSFAFNTYLDIISSTGSL